MSNFGRRVNDYYPLNTPATSLTIGPSNSLSGTNFIKFPRQLFTALSGLPITATNPLNLPIKAHGHAPIRVAHKHRVPASRKQQNKYVSSPMFDSRGFPDRQDEFESMLPEVDAGRLIRKRKHVAPPLTDIDPNFGVEYDELLHGNMLRTELDVSHLTPPQQATLTALIKR